MYRLNIALLVVSIAFLHHAQGTTTHVECKNNTDCAAGQCCYIVPEFLVVSRRDSMMPAMDLPIPPQHVKHDTGRCEYYHRRGELCDGLEVMNGHCGCAAGLSCQWVAEPTTTAATRGRRGPPFHLRPGSYQTQLKYSNSGVCEAYLKRGTPCHGIEHCGCEARLSCKWVLKPTATAESRHHRVPTPTSTAATRHRRTPIPIQFNHGPGSIQCA